MGTKVLATSKTDTKPNFTVSTVVAGSMAIIDGQFASFVGDTTVVNLPEWIGLERCKEGLREAGWPNPGTGTFNTAQYDTVTNTLTVTLAGAIPALSEDECVLIQGFDFSYAGESNSAIATRQAEAFLESAKAA
jgi:hypothetical protein